METPFTSPTSQKIKKRFLIFFLLTVRIHILAIMVLTLMEAYDYITRSQITTNFYPQSFHGRQLPNVPIISLLKTTASIETGCVCGQVPIMS